MNRLFLIALLSCVCVLFGLIAGCNHELHSDEIDIEVYDFDFDGHNYMIFTEYGRTISVVHDPDCRCIK